MGKPVRLAAMALSVALAGCTHFPYDFGMRSASMDSYVLVSKHGSRRCYTRITDGQPLDQICEKGGFVRYSPEPRRVGAQEPIPEYVLAIFEGIDRENPAFLIAARSARDFNVK